MEKENNYTIDGESRVEVEKCRSGGAPQIPREAPSTPLPFYTAKQPPDPFVDAVRQIAYDVHVYLGNGYLEKVYENCLKHRLEKAGYHVEAQKNLKVFDVDGFEIGDYFADLVVDNCLIIELKSVKALAGEHYAQTLNYLRITGYQKALLINFGSYRFETRTVVPNFNDNGRVEVEKCRSGGVAPQTPREAPSSPLHFYTADTFSGSGAEPQFSSSTPLHG